MPGELSRWRVFVWLVAVAEVARSLNVHEWIWDRDPTGALTLVLGVALAFRPSSTALLFGVIAARLAYFALRLPDAHNQEWIEAQVLAGVLLVWAIRQPRGDEERFATVAPVVRAALVVVYGATAFHKLNADFFDPQVGCSAVMWRAGAERWGLPASWGAAAPAATVALELGLPVLLLVRKTRAVGLLLGLAFHGWLAVDVGVFSFSAMMVAYLAAFLPQAWVDRWNGLLRPGRSLFVVILGAVALSGATAALYVGLTAGPRLKPLGQMWWSALGLALLAAAVHAAAGRSGDPEPAFPRNAPRLLPGLLAAAMLAHAASPYLGLKTMTSLSMYSNLRTEGPFWNHWIVPRSTQVFAYQDDLVTITASSDAIFRQIADEELLLPRFELGRRLRRYGPSLGSFWVEYQDATGAFRFEHSPDGVSDPQVLLAEGSPLLDKWLHFNRVDPGPKQRCRSDRPPMRRRLWRWGGGPG